MVPLPFEWSTLVINPRDLKPPQSREKSDKYWIGFVGISLLLRKSFSSNEI